MRIFENILLNERNVTVLRQRNTCRNATENGNFMLRSLLAMGITYVEVVIVCFIKNDMWIERS
jgi:hypothetical protein